MIDENLERLIKIWRSNESPCTLFHFKENNKEGLVIECKDLGWNICGDVIWSTKQENYIFIIKGIYDIFTDIKEDIDSGGLAYVEYLTLLRLLQSCYGLDFFDFSDEKTNNVITFKKIS